MGDLTERVTVVVISTENVHQPPHRGHAIAGSGQRGHGVLCRASKRTPRRSARVEHAQVIGLEKHRRCARTRWRCQVGG
eukprot:3074227-Rhodomonas_salina.4